MVSISPDISGLQADPVRPYWLPTVPQVDADWLRRLTEDYDRLASLQTPLPLQEYLADNYRVDLTTRYAGLTIPNPWGKASGQLSMTTQQVEDDVAAGLGFVVLKTVIAEDAAGDQSMAAWAIKAARMVVEPITSQSGETGWTVTWKGRGWWHSFNDYLQLLRESKRCAAGSGTLVVPSCKYHLPASGEGIWRQAEYDETTRRLLAVWRESTPDQPMPLEKDFSPTLAGSDKAAQQAAILDWLRQVPGRIRQTVPAASLRIGLKLFNALFEDEFQLDQLMTSHLGQDRCDYLIYGNRLFDPQRDFEGHRGVAYGGPDLSDRNLRIMSRWQARVRRGEVLAPPLEWSATGNIVTGKMAWEYALRGASSFQLHTFFQLPTEAYRLTVGNRTQKALHELYLHPQHGFLVWMRHLAEAWGMADGHLKLLDLFTQIERNSWGGRGAPQCGSP